MGGKDYDTMVCYTHASFDIQKVYDLHRNWVSHVHNQPLFSGCASYLVRSTIQREPYYANFTINS